MGRRAYADSGMRQTNGAFYADRPQRGFPPADCAAFSHADCAAFRPPTARLSARRLRGFFARRLRGFFARRLRGFPPADCAAFRPPTARLFVRRLRGFSSADPIRDLVKTPAAYDLCAAFAFPARGRAKRPPYRSQRHTSAYFPRAICAPAERLRTHGLLRRDRVTVNS